MPTFYALPPRITLDSATGVRGGGEESPLGGQKGTMQPEFRASPFEKRYATVCYMEKASVRIRELRQNLSKYVKRAAAGETLRVTERGRPVAILAPLPEKAHALDRLVAEGKAIPPRLDFRTLERPAPAQPGFSISRALRAQRKEKGNSR